jgi:O-methyltransferase
MLGDLTNYLNKLRDVPGDFAEFGCFEGDITMQLARESGRRVWAWDTFEGMPDDNYIEELDKSDPPGKWKPHNKPLEVFAHSGFDIVPVIGKFSETIPAFSDPDVRFAFVHIDCDHYWAYKRVLEFITPRMSPGGIVRMDDYGCCAGARKAADEWSAATNHKLEGDMIYF